MVPPPTAAFRAVVSTTEYPALGALAVPSLAVPMTRHAEAMAPLRRQARHAFPCHDPASCTTAPTHTVGPVRSLWSRSRIFRSTGRTKSWGIAEQYYRKDGTRRRVEVHDESGFTPPQLAQFTLDGPWVRAKDAPAPPNPHFLDEDYIAVTADTIKSHARLKLLDAAAQKRYFAIQWDNLVTKWKGETGSIHEELGTPESAAQWAEARGAYKESHTQMGKSAEDLGEKAAEHHFIAERYPDFDKQSLLGPKSGNDQFDQGLEASRRPRSRC
ncbi:hypothetical protein RB201_13405 [Streptomyces sp. S1A(2023)]